MPSTSKPPAPSDETVPADELPSPQLIVAVNWAAVAKELASVNLATAPSKAVPAVGWEACRWWPRSGASATLAVESIVTEAAAGRGDDDGDGVGAILLV